ncbi:hypothetical protein R3P38DRAFT_3315303 [Favolaschia claudopus]|uniref:DUF6532 domain-containing protein n=1 Tax=Favolaschia claudopus TaxID=2862362 RepID=A0AAW0BMF7_9AGAR
MPPRKPTGAGRQKSLSEAAASKGLRPDRAANPGNPDKPRTPRTHEEVEAEKAKKAHTKKQAQQKRVQSINRAAAIENQMLEDDSVRRANANRPPPTDSRKIPRLRPKTHTAPAEEQIQDPDPFEGSGSDDEFQPDSELDTGDPDVEFESEDDLMDASEDEQPPPKPVKTKPPKPSIRRDVEAERLRQGGTVADGKRKATSSQQAKKQKKASIGGIRVGWNVERGRSPSVDLTQLHRARSSSSGVMSFMSRRSASSDAGFGGPPGSDSSVIGGVTSDEDDGEEGVVERENVEVARKKTASIAGIVDTDVPGYVDPSTHHRAASSSSKLKKSDINLTNIPSDIRSDYKIKFTPPLLDFVGSLEGWADPTQEELIHIWNVTFPTYCVAGNDEAQVQIIVKLAQGKVEGWRNRIATAGIAAWKQQFRNKTKQEIVDEVKKLLEGTDRDRMFYYRDVERDEEGKVLKCKGIFQSKAFSRVLGVHSAATASESMPGPVFFDSSDPNTYPVGALTLACQSLKRGLNYFKTGELVVPAGTSGHFSKTNWQDRYDNSEGVHKVIPSTSAITKVVKKLNATHWDKIIKAAKAASTQSDAPAATAVVIDVDADTADDDFELRDDDSDA